MPGRRDGQEFGQPLDDAEDDRGQPQAHRPASTRRRRAGRGDAANWIMDFPKLKTTCEGAPERCRTPLS